MDALLPRSREKRKPGRSRSMPLSTNTIAKDYQTKLKEIPPNQHEKSKLEHQDEETTSTRRHTNDAYPQSRLVNEWSHLEPDERGTELARDARIWKVYVGETDKWDKELVEGWDKSMDVLLGKLILGVGKAALFSAISGAFLIETSNQLKEDPADVSAAALRVIAHVLLGSNNSTMDPSALPPVEGAFAPSKLTIIINTLWYMSLSLSIATAFLAMLAKDWCYSFLAHRTGHPRDQAHRRQRKWKLIQRWKMEELIIALPSLMHFSLLLFAVGLCIYLWELNITIAIPVMCIAGAFLAFYIWSSIAASIVDDFPYTTVINRILRSNYLEVLRRSIVRLANIIAVFVWLVFVGAGAIYLILLLLLSVALYLVQVSFNLPAACLLLPFHLLGYSTPVVYLGAFTNQFANRVSFLLKKTMAFPFTLSDRLAFRFDEAKKRLELSEDLLTSLALSWLIEHCETPSAVDIALQAIASASQRVPKEPLLASGATERIMRRIVTHDVHGDSKSKNRIYIRALATLGLNSNTRLGEKKGHIIDDVGVMIWDLKSRNESIVADFIKYENFVPSNHNLAAIRIGNSAASQSLDILMGEATNSRQALYAIQMLLYGHLEAKDKELHPAALQTLANAAAFYFSVSKNPESHPGLVDLFMQFCALRISAAEELPRIFPALTSFIVCVLIHGSPCERGVDRPAGTQALDLLRNRAWYAIRTLTDISAEGESFRSLIFWIGASEILSNPVEHGLDQGDDEWKSLHDWCGGRVSQFVQDWTFTGEAALDDHVHVAPNDFLRITSQVYELIEVSRPEDSGPIHLSESLYTIIALIACGNPRDKQQSQTCNELVAKFGFPRLSAEFIASLELKTNKEGQTLLSEIKKSYTSDGHPQKHFAATQIWLLLRLIGDASSELQKRLQMTVERILEDCLQLQNKGSDHVKLDLEALIIDGYRTMHRINSKEDDDGKGWLSVRKKIKALRLKCLTGSNVLNSSTRNVTGMNTLGIKVEDHRSPEQNQRTYTSRIIELILETRGLQDNEDLLPLIADDFKALPPRLQRFSPSLEPLLAPLFASLPPSRATSRVLIQTEAVPTTFIITEPLATGADHVAVEIQDSLNPPYSEDHRIWA